MKRAKFITHSAIIASLYVVLTFIANLLGIASGAIQVRLSEALTILPYFTPSAIPGLFMGCIISNLLTGAPAIDIIFGSIATLIGAIGSYGLKRYKWAVPLPPIISNALIIPFVLAYAYQIEESIPYMMLTVGAGELISAGILGMLLLTALTKHKDIF